jgi:hypothetical protein
MKKVFASLALLALVGAGCNTQTSSNKGPDGQELKLTTAKKLTIAQEGAAEVEVTLERKKFDEPVTIKIETPEGVTVTEGDLKMDKGVNKRTFVLKATDKAKVGEHKIIVMASSGDMKDRNEVALHVKEKSTSSTSGSSPVSGGEAELKKKRDELGKDIKAQMTKIDESMTTLREQVKTADAKTKEALNTSITELDAKRKNLDEQYRQVQTTTAERWSEFSTNLTNAATELEKGVKKALEQFKK